MKAKHLWLAWLYFFILCAVLGFLPAPDGLVKALLVLVSVAFFIPGFWLAAQGEKKTVKTVIAICTGILLTSVVLIILNFASALMSPVWGRVLYVLLVVLTTPMVCGQIWVLSLFGWACLLFFSIFRLKSSGK